MLYLTCTTITSVDLAHYGVTRGKDLLSVDCGTMQNRGTCCLKKYFNTERSKGIFVRENLKK